MTGEGAGETEGALTARRALGLVLMVLGVLMVVVGLVAWFAAIWAHGHDLTTRLSGTGFLAVIVGAGFTGSGWLVRG